MKTIYTGYFRQINEYKKRGLIPISIARSKPHWAGPVLEFKVLAPSSELLKDSKAGKIGREEYEWQFMEALNSQEPGRILECLPTGCVLLCWEKATGDKPEDWCHRHMVAHWIKTKTGIVVPEVNLHQQENLFL